jgi:hypothetical protein
MKQDLIYKMLFSEEKVELSSEKVELGLVDDYNSRIDKANNARKKSAMALSKLESSLQEAVTHFELALKEADKIEKAAKELGVQSPIDIKRVEVKAKQFQKSLAAVKGLSIDAN